MNLVYVWYSDGSEFIPDTLHAPFLSNLRFCAKYTPCHVFYYVNTMQKSLFEEELAKRMTSPDKSTSRSDGRPLKNVVLHDFSVAFPDHLPTLLGLNTLAQKIDYMKLITLLKGFRVVDSSQSLMLIDFDCVVKRCDLPVYDVEPFYCKETMFLRRDSEPGETDSYIENYATRVTKRGSDVLLRLFPGDSIILEQRDASNSYVYRIYVSMIIKYFQQFHGYAFPEKYISLSLKSSADIEYERGSSWKPAGVPSEEEAASWPVKYAKPFSKGSGDSIARYVLFDDFGKFYNAMLREINFPFHVKSYWLNDDQRYGTLEEMVRERIKTDAVNLYVSVINSTKHKQSLYSRYCLSSL